ncbi:hypothetical protein C9374_007239 [Naegleria lovaniensis]|uniref:GATA-type domain-containing protein n=1 Tax=Naegleria lovaniensis TaxID=51637 RepID=A0AA88GZ61_NAELO|nr:uncharacterized protein C9374_007239 [Naegleria lovaniensis]KAG2393708.1 hypothetical protein C9374_007239 [Naegleria lovaniensis]
MDTNPLFLQMNCLTYQTFTPMEMNEEEEWKHVWNDFMNENKAEEEDNVSTCGFPFIPTHHGAPLSRSGVTTTNPLVMVDTPHETCESLCTFSAKPRHHVGQPCESNASTNSLPTWNSHITLLMEETHAPTSTCSKSNSNANSTLASASTSNRRRPYIRKSRDCKCHNCGTSKTPMWRKNQEGKPLCNKCGLYLLRYDTNRPMVEKLKFGRRGHKRKLDSNEVIEQQLQPRAQKQQFVTTLDETATRLSDSCKAWLEISNNHEEISQPCVDKPRKAKKKKHDDEHVKETNQGQVGIGNSESMQPVSSQDEEEGWNSLASLNHRLRQASERFPEIIHTLISIIRKHVLTQPQVVSQIISSRMEFPTQEQFTHQQEIEGEVCELERDSFGIF